MSRTIEITLRINLSEPTHSKNNFFAPDFAAQVSELLVEGQHRINALRNGDGKIHEIEKVEVAKVINLDGGYSAFRLICRGSIGIPQATIDIFASDAEGAISTAKQFSQELKGGDYWNYSLFDKEALIAGWKIVRETKISDFTVL